MVFRLSTSDASWRTTLQQRLAVKAENNPEIIARVQQILQDVQQHGDDAVLRYTTQFDGITHTTATMRVSPKAIAHAITQCTTEALDALKLAHARITDYHQRQKPQNLEYQDAHGNLLGWRWSPVDAAGLYVPGGLASYPSSVLMNAIPAIVAGVPRIAMMVPSPKGALNPLVLAAAQLCSITEIYTLGGAQAIGALAYGTASIAPVDVICGPGNAYVAAAKKLVYGSVGIDMVAGPSEILVIADDSTPPAWLAADLLSQAEHDRDARALLITTSDAVANAVEHAVEAILPNLSRANIARESWQHHGLILTVKNLEEAAEAANLIATEHLELCLKKPHDILPNIRHAGAIFIGRYTPESIGDYTAGPSHVLPTAASARFSSGLGVLNFMKRTSLIGCSEGGFNALASATAALADAEGLSAHALAVRVRMQ